MRIYQSFTEALSEIKRDISEMGIDVHTSTYQNKYIGSDPEMATKEVQNYIYTVIEPEGKDLNPSQPWAEVEFAERIASSWINPGEAYKLRPEVWDEFINPPTGRFDYSYNERIGNCNQLEEIIYTLTCDPNSRQCFLSVWQPTDANKLGGFGRIPCTLGYQFQIREGKLNITYLQRSADFATHFNNDLYLAWKLQKYIAERLNVPVGVYTHWIGSLHVFKRDIKGVF